MALRALAGKLKGLLLPRPSIADPELGMGGKLAGSRRASALPVPPSPIRNCGRLMSLKRRMVRYSALVIATSVGTLAFTVPRLLETIVDLDKLKAKKKAASRVLQQLHELDNIQDEAAKAKALSGLLQKLVDLGEGEKVSPLLEVVKQMEQEATHAEN